MTRAFEHDRNADSVITPTLLRYGIRLVQVKRDLVFEILGSNLQFAIRAWPNRDECRQVDGCRHHKAVVVVGVFAAQIDASGRAKSSWIIIAVGLRHQALSATHHLRFAKS